MAAGQNALNHTIKAVERISTAFCVSKNDVLTRSMQAERVHPAWQCFGNDFSASCSEKSFRPVKPADTMKNEGLTAHHCIHLCMYGLF